MPIECELADWLWTAETVYIERLYRSTTRICELFEETLRACDNSIVKWQSYFGYTSLMGPGI